MIENLEKLLATLNQIEVKGEGNLNRLLGCIQLLRKMLEESVAEQSRGRNENGV